MSNLCGYSSFHLAKTKGGEVAIISVLVAVEMMGGGEEWSLF
jgi:hypothetical protein